MTSQHRPEDKDEMELEPETIEDLDAQDDDADRIQGGCFGTHGQIRAGACPTSKPV